MKVLCVDDDFDLQGLNIKHPVKGKIYTMIATALGSGINIVIQLKELPLQLWDINAFQYIDNTGNKIITDNTIPREGTIAPIIVGLPGT